MKGRPLSSKVELEAKIFVKSFALSGENKVTSGTFTIV